MMNQKIKDLYGQAVLFVFENKVGVEGQKEGLQEAINERFAELIFLEICNLLDIDNVKKAKTGYVLTTNELLNRLKIILELNNE